MDSENSNPLTYTGYLKLDGLLNCQQRRSDHHDEHLFIVTHQAYELWFKQILFEMDSAFELLKNLPLASDSTLDVIIRLGRIATIMKHLVSQFDLLETMTPMNFLDFRGYLGSASGFQSFQFRDLEKLFGVKRAEPGESGGNLFTAVVRWLENIPELDYEKVWKDYLSSADQWLTEDYKLPAENETDQNQKRNKMTSYESQRDAFDTIKTEEKYKEHGTERDDRERRLSFKAFQGAMVIMLYRNDARFQQSYQILKLLMDIDNLIMRWRYNHVTMVLRYIGRKPGTGGSTGYDYLTHSLTDRNKSFLDLFNMSTFLIPSKFVVPL